VSQVKELIVFVAETLKLKELVVHSGEF